MCKKIRMNEFFREVDSNKIFVNVDKSNKIYHSLDGKELEDLCKSIITNDLEKIDSRVNDLISLDFTKEGVIVTFKEKIHPMSLSIILVTLNNILTSNKETSDRLKRVPKRLLYLVEDYLRRFDSIE